jgi:hypothetical protein
LERDPRNKTGVNYFIFDSLQNLAEYEAQRGNLKEARAALADGRRVIEKFVQQSGFDPEVIEISNLEMNLMDDVDLLRASGDHAAIHSRAVALQDGLAKVKHVTEGNTAFREDAIRNAKLLQVESALRLGHPEEAVNEARSVLANFPVGGLGKRGVNRMTAQFESRLGQALVAAGKRDEGLKHLESANAHYRAEMAKGASETHFRLEFGRLLYELARAQPADDAGRARRKELLTQAAAVVDGLSFEVKQWGEAKELMQWVAAAQHAPASI